MNTKQEKSPMITVRLTEAELIEIRAKTGVVPIVASERPKKMVTVRVTEDELADIHAQADSAGISANQFMRVQAGLEDMTPLGGKRGRRAGDSNNIESHEIEVTQ